MIPSDINIGLLSPDQYTERVLLKAIDFTLADLDSEKSKDALKYIKEFRTKNCADKSHIETY